MLSRPETPVPRQAMPSGEGTRGTLGWRGSSWPHRTAPAPTAHPPLPAFQPASHPPGWPSGLPGALGGHLLWAQPTRASQGALSQAGKLWPSPPTRMVSQGHSLGRVSSKHVHSGDTERPSPGRHSAPASVPACRRGCRPDLPRRQGCPVHPTWPGCLPSWGALGAVSPEAGILMRPVPTEGLLLPEAPSQPSAAWSCPGPCR